MTATQDHHSVPAHRRARNWHGALTGSVANPRRTRGLTLAGQAPASDQHDEA